MKCVDARQLIHLSVGDDALPQEEQKLQEHLRHCADCRSYRSGSVDAMRALQSLCDESSEEAAPESVWPALAAQIRSRSVQPARRVRQFNSTVAAMCACSIMLALVTIVQNLPDPSRQLNQHAIPSATGASWQTGGQMWSVAPEHVIRRASSQNPEFSETDSRWRTGNVIFLPDTRGGIDF